MVFKIRDPKLLSDGEVWNLVTTVCPHFLENRSSFSDASKQNSTDFEMEENNINCSPV